jgi:hypothetical protein
MLKLLVILAVVAVIALAVIAGCRNPATEIDPDTVELKHMERLAYMVLLYRKENNTLPTSLADAKQFDETCEFTDYWGTEIEYESDGKTFLMISAGADKEFGTADDITFNLRKTPADTSEPGSEQ